MLELSDSRLEKDEIDNLVATLYSQAGLRTGDDMTMAAFKKLFASDEYEKVLEKATLQIQGRLSLQSMEHRMLKILNFDFIF